MKTIVFNTFLALLALLAGCRPSAASADLNRADCVMESNADSALAILLSIDTAVLASKADRALYDLLLTQAEDKCNMPITHSSGIASAIEYFSNHEPKRNLMRAYFYDAVAMYNASDYQKSMHDALSSYDIAEELNNTYWQAKTSELISFIFSKNFNSYGALPYTKKAVDLYEKSGKHRNHLFALVDYAIDLGFSNNRIRSKEIIDSIYDIAKSNPTDSSLMAYCLHAQISNALALKEYDSIFEISERLKTFENVCRIKPLAYYALSRFHIEQRELQKAKDAIEEANLRYTNRGDSVALLEAEISLAEAQGDMQTAYDKTKLLMSFEFAEMSKILKQSISMTQRDFYTTKAIKEIERNHRIKLNIFIISIIVIVIVSLITYFVIIHFRRKNDEIDRKVDEIWDLTQEIETQQQKNIKSDKDMAGLTALADNLFKDQWNVISMLCEEFYEKRESKLSRNFVLERIEEELAKLISDENINKIEPILNKTKDSIIEKLKDECTFLSDQDIKFITLIMAGFSFRTICIILQLKRMTFYQRRLRLIDRIQKSDAPHKQAFIDYMKLGK